MKPITRYSKACKQHWALEILLGLQYMSSVFQAGAICFKPHCLALTVPMYIHVPVQHQNIARDLCKTLASGGLP